MPALVTPELTIQRLSSKAELEAWANARSVHWQLRGNLSQLLGLDPLPAGRTRHQATSYFLLHEASWMCHADNTFAAIPVFGSMPQKYKSLLEQATVIFSLATFKRLLATQGKVSDDGWYSGPAPEALDHLADGAYITKLPAHGQQATQTRMCFLCVSGVMS